MLKLLAKLMTFGSLSGCAATLAQVSAVPSQDYAALTVVTETGVSDGTYGINGVGNPHTIKTPSAKVYVAAGRRTIWYGCPGYVYTDWGPSIRYTFKAGAAYELVCGPSDRTFIRPIPTQGM